MKANEAYCVRCNKPRRMYHPVEKALANGRLSLVDKCQVCGATLSRLKESDVTDPDELEIPGQVRKRSGKCDILGSKWSFRLHHPCRRDLICGSCKELYSTFLPSKRDCGRCANCYVKERIYARQDR